MEDITTTETTERTNTEKKYLGNIDLSGNQVREALTGYLMHTSEDVRTLAERPDINVECNFSWNVGTEGLRASFFAWPSEETATEEVTEETATEEETEETATQEVTEEAATEEVE